MKNKERALSTLDLPAYHFRHAEIHTCQAIRKPSSVDVGHVLANKFEVGASAGSVARFCMLELDV